MIAHIKLHAGWLVLRLKQRWHWLDQIKILPYRGYGTPDVVYLKGRVVEKKGIMPATARDPAWRNLLNMYRRFSASAIAGAHVRVRLGATTCDVVTDAGGYFEAQLRPQRPLAAPGWHTVDVEVMEPVMPNQQVARAAAQVLVPPAGAAFGVVSDIDDTVIKSSATRVLKMLRIVLLNNAHTRLPFGGVAALYQALQRGASGDQTNPIFYVSSSPWNMYDLIVDFLDIHGLPVDPLFLRDWSSRQEQLRNMQHQAHKLEQIERLFTLYPDLPFILIGDSGQEDPEIYRQVVRDFAGRVLAIYIRDVAPPPRAAVVHALADEVRALGASQWRSWRPCWAAAPNTGILIPNFSIKLVRVRCSIWALLSDRVDCAVWADQAGHRLGVDHVPRTPHPQ